MCFIRLDIIILFCSWCGVFFVSSYHNRGQFLSPGSRIYMGNFWNFFGFQLKATVYAYYKPTNSLSYLLYLSSHPSHVKNSIPFSQFLRLRRLCSDDSDFFETLEHRYTWLSYFCPLSGPSPCPTNWSTVSTTNGWGGKQWPHSIYSHISPSQPRS